MKPAILVLLALALAAAACDPIESEPEPSTPGACKDAGGVWECEEIPRPGGGVAVDCGCSL